MKLSTIIITYNEAQNIERCIRSVQKVSDEVVILDSFSTDRTPDICRSLGVRFEQRVYRNQIDQKNHVLTLAAHDHVLSLDGDEALSEELADSILHEKENGFPNHAYLLNRLSFYCGKWIRHGDWYPDWKLRLWNKHRANWGGVNPHDRVFPEKGINPQKLNGDLFHFTFATYSEHKNQVKKYAEISAASYLSRKRKFALFRMILSPITCLVKSYLFKGGFLDGQHGWQIIKLAMMEKYLKYKRLRQLQKEDTNRRAF